MVDRQSIDQQTIESMTEDNDLFIHSNFEKQKVLKVL